MIKTVGEAGRLLFVCRKERRHELNDRVKLLGYRTKQDYMIEAVLKNEVHAMGNPQMVLQFKKDLRAILAELERLNNISEIGEDTMTPIRTMLEIMEAFQAGREKS
jgi:hypothetical protein